MKNLFDWPFLKEPFYRWCIFLVAISLFLVVWHFILRHIKYGGVLES
jgi:hypothetical protein